MFSKLNEFLRGRHCKSGYELKDAVMERLGGPTAEVYDEGVQKLITGYDKCRNVGDYCVEI
jgi:hypothetical protein